MNVTSFGYHRGDCLIRYVSCWVDKCFSMLLVFSQYYNTAWAAHVLTLLPHLHNASFCTECGLIVKWRKNLRKAGIKRIGKKNWQHRRGTILMESVCVNRFWTPNSWHENTYLFHDGGEGSDFAIMVWFDPLTDEIHHLLTAQHIPRKTFTKTAHKDVCHNLFL